MGAIWGLLASLSIGASDYSGRRLIAASHALTAAVLTQVVGVVLSLVAVAIVPSTWNLADMGFGALSGIGFALGLGCYYIALSRSSATIAAPIVGTLSALGPFTYAIVRGADASTFAIVGGLVAIVGIGLISSGEFDRTLVVRGLPWALASGTGYAVGVSALVDVSEDAGVWPAVPQRAMAALLLAAAAIRAGQAVTAPRGHARDAVIGGALASVSSVFILLGLAVNETHAVITASTFPAFSVVIGVLFYADRLSGRQLAGLLAVSVGVAAVVAS